MRSDKLHRDFGEREGSALNTKQRIDECKVWSEANRTKDAKASTESDACCIAENTPFTR